MTVQQLCEKYGIYVEKDIDIAWDLHVTKEKDLNTADYNAAMLIVVGKYFRTRREKEQTYLVNDEKALDFLVLQINALLKRNGQPLAVSAKAKTRNKAASAACGKLDWHGLENCPTDINITEEGGKFLCEIRSTIVCTKKFGEKTMELVENDRFTTHWLAIAYGAMCKNSCACYQIGIALSDRDRSRAARVWDDIERFPFSDVVITGKNWGNPNATTRYTLKPVMPVYWFYLGAQGGGINSTYRAAKIFREQNVYPMFEKYMFDLTTYENDHRSEAELTMLEFYATETGRKYVISQNQRELLLSRLVDKYADSSVEKLSRQAWMALAEMADRQKKKQNAVRFYQRAGITSPEKANDEDQVHYMAYTLYSMDRKEEAKEWLLWLYNFGSSCDVEDVSYKIGKIHMERWQKSKNIKDAASAAAFWEDCTLNQEEMITLLRLHLDKVIQLDDQETVEFYAGKCCPVMDAEMAATLAVRFWKADKMADLPLPVTLMRRALDQNKTNGVYWNNLGVMLSQNTLYGQGFSAQKLKEAESCFENALRYGYGRARLRLSDCCWSDEKEGFAQDLEKAKRLLTELLEADREWARYPACSRLARIARMEKRPVDTVVAHLAEAYTANPKGTAVGNFHNWYGQWLSGYVELMHREGTLQEEAEKLFCGNYDFLYAVALAQETAGSHLAAILLYGCCAAMGNKKALCNLYNMAKPGTDYFAKREVTT